MGTTPGANDIGEDDDGCGTWASILRADLLAGTYYVLIEGYYYWDCGEYVLSVYPTPGEAEPLLAVTDNSVGPNVGRQLRPLR